MLRNQGGRPPQTPPKTALMLRNQGGRPPQTPPKTP